MDNTGIKFLTTVFEKAAGLIELRAFPSCARVFSRDIRALDEFIKSHLSENVFFGAATRRSGKDGTKLGVLEVPTLWTDVDWKNFPGGQHESDQIVQQFPRKPSFTIATGHGTHLYWRLRRPVPATLSLEPYLAGMARALGGDPAAAEIARVLRLPGTFNWKREKRAVKVLQSSSRLYSLRDFESWKAPGIEPRAKHVVVFTNQPHVDPTKFPLSSRMRALIENGWQAPPYQSRSEADMAVITALVRAHATDNEIRATFLQYPIGEKFRELGDGGDRYLACSIANARAYVGSEI